MVMKWGNSVWRDKYSIDYYCCVHHYNHEEEGYDDTKIHSTNNDSYRRRLKVKRHNSKLLSY